MSAARTNPSANVDVADALQRWHPIATEYDLEPRSLFRTKLLGHELVVWRADDGFVNVWENRCLHRGVRLSIGTNDGAELICRYHAWRYSNRTAGCTYIPAHPADSPARTITNKTFPVTNRYGLVWSSQDPQGEVPELSVLDSDTLGLRNLPVNAPVGLVLKHLAAHTFLPSGVIAPGLDVAAELAAVEMSAEVSTYSATLRAQLAGNESAAVFFVQPVDANRSVIRPVLGEEPRNTVAVLRHHAAVLADLVRDIERAAAAIEFRPSLPSALEVPVELPTVAVAVGRSAPLRVSVRRKWAAAAGITAFELVSNAPDPLPTFQPGAHIDVHLPGGLVRQYSITNGPGETDCYRIAVKRDPESRGGSVALHDSVHQGDELQISEPRNSFPLRRNVPHTVLIAGGIGATPLIAMAKALHANGLGFDLHYFVSQAEELAFRDHLAEFGDQLHEHVGLSPQETGEQLSVLLAEPSANKQVYACGPPPMLDAIRAVSSDQGWPANAVHFEYFKNTTELEQGSSFVLELARSGLTLDVPSGATVLEVLRENDVPIVSSCEQGACGTCAATVLEGDLLHQDVYLNPTERAAGHTILTCVSRATSNRLVLDL